jgi:hypothetical protein
MERNNAKEYYYFGREFYECLHARAPDNVVFFYALVDGSICSCELVLFEGHYSHSFLGGTSREALEKCPNPLLKREILRFARSKGCRYFLLGGGNQKDDGIFKYKSSFCPDGIYPSRIGGTVFEPGLYSSLAQQMKEQGEPINESRFQFYDAS